MRLRKELLAHGVGGGAMRPDTLVRFLMHEEFETVHDLAGPSNGSKFRGASGLELAGSAFSAKWEEHWNSDAQGLLTAAIFVLRACGVDTPLQASVIGSIIAQVMPRAVAKCADTKVGPMHTLQKLD